MKPATGRECPNCKGGKKVGIHLDQEVMLHLECPECRGVGRVNIRGTCDRCNGKGDIITLVGVKLGKVACPDCEGTGKDDFQLNPLPRIAS